jgi:hypothetical protein
MTKFTADASDFAKERLRKLIAKEAMNPYTLMSRLEKSHTTVMRYVMELYKAEPRQAFIEKWELRGEGNQARYVACFRLGDGEDAEKPVINPILRAELVKVHGKKAVSNAKRDPLVAALFGN